MDLTTGNFFLDMVYVLYLVNGGVVGMYGVKQLDILLDCVRSIQIEDI